MYLYDLFDDSLEYSKSKSFNISDTPGQLSQKNNNENFNEKENEVEESLKINNKDESMNIYTNLNNINININNCYSNNNNNNIERYKSTTSNKFQEDDEYQTINDKLQFLYNLSSNYYNEIKENFVSLKNYTEISISEVDKLLNECANITYRTFTDKYENISNEVESIDNIQDKNEKDIPLIEHLSYSKTLNLIQRQI